MKTSKFSEEQILRILKEAEASEKSIQEVCRAHSISEATFYKWRTKYGGLQVNQAKHLRQTEQENSQLKRMVADLMLENNAIREALKKL